MTRPRAILLTVVGGYLGAGKTTLLNHVLRDAGDRRLAVLVNDFGAIDIDAELIESREGEMVSLSNGCICCGIGGDFIAALASLRDIDDPPEQVVVEASGVADPAQIAVFGDIPGYVRDAVVVVADAETVRARADDDATGHQVRAQLRAADLLVLNKTDLVQATALPDLRAWLRDLVGPSTSIVDAAFGAVPTDVLIGAREPALAADRASAVARRRAADLGAAHPPLAGHDDHVHAAGHGHDGDAHHPAYETWSWSGARPLSGAGLVDAIAALPEGIVRAKGILHLREDPASRYILQLVGRRYAIEPDRAWGEDEPSSRVVVIGLPGSVDAPALDATMAALSSAAQPAAIAGG
jgi:G3E family GTPase